MIRTAAATAATILTATALAACGGSSSPSSTAASQTARKNTGLKLAECMRSHGVPNFPDPKSGGGFGFQAAAGGGSVSIDGHTLNVSGSTFQKAMLSCRKVLPQGPPISGSQLAKIKRGALKMAQCMRAHGVKNFPDPQITTGPGGHGIGVRIGGPGAVARGSFDPNSPAFQRAQKACRSDFGPKFQAVG